MVNIRPTLLGLALCAIGLLGPAARGAEPPPRPPDPRRGEALYVGTAPLAAGGAPCLACHGIAGHGLDRAASFGPDLSGAHDSYGADGLDSMLEDIVFPSMEPIYRGHAVTKEERADLIAFLAESTGGRPAQLGAGFGAGIAGAMGLFLVGVVLVGKRGARRRDRAAGSHRRTP